MDPNSPQPNMAQRILVRNIPAVYEWLDLRRLVFFALFITLLLSIKLTDPDYFWHLRTGQYLFENQALPEGDIFSFTHTAQPWVLHEWLFELLLYCTYILLGPFGVKLLTASLATASVVLAHATVQRLLGKPNVALLIALAFFTQAAASISPRPQLISILLFAVFIRVLTEFKYFQATRSLLLLPALMVIWVNSHGGYAAGIALMVLFTACEWMLLLARGSNDKIHQRRIYTLTIITFTCVLASLVNPYFIQHWFYPFDVVNMEASRSLIAEWRSPDFHSMLHKSYLVIVFVTLTAAIYRRKRPDVTEIAIPLFFVMLGFIAVRHIPFATLALIPLAATSLAQPSLQQLAPVAWLDRLAALRTRLVGKGSDLGRTEFTLNWLLLAFMIAGCLLYYPIKQKADEDRINITAPAKATDFVIYSGLKGRLFNTYHHGGYLIYRLYPEQKVFIDGRADMYGDAFIQEYIAIASGQPGWKERLNKHKIDYVITPHDAALSRLIVESGEFRLVYEDEVNSVMVRDIPKYTEIISKYAK
jgi:hypothetical protein